MKTNTRQTLKYYLKYSSKQKLLGLFMLLGIIGAAITNVIIPLYFKDFFDALVADQSRDLIVKSLISILVIIAGLELVQWAFWRLATFTAVIFYCQVMKDLSNMCFAYLHKHSVSFFEGSFVGSLVKRVKWFTNSFEGIFDRVLWHLLPTLINITVIIVVLARKSTWLVGGVLLWLVVFMLVNYVFTIKKLKYDIEKSEAESAVTGHLADTITNNINVKLFNGYSRETKGYAGVINNLMRLKKLTWNLDNIFEAAQGFLMVGLEIGIFYLAIILWQRGTFTVGDFVLIQAYLINIFMRVWDFGRIFRSIYNNLADAEEMTEILQTPHAIRDAHDAKELKVTEGRIEFKDVDFYYHETRPILKKFNLEVKPRERIALIGPSGAGKSTIIKLLLRNYDLAGGKILIDGQKVAKAKLESLWRNISLVPQDPVLFHRTLMENIRYGRPQATDKEVIRAAKAARCHEFIKNFPEGYDTYVGERGVKLSGGERQRVAIARAILRNAPILVLDEATSSLDSESEMLIQEALDNLMKDKTVIVIAHRLSTIRKADRIIVVDAGGIREEGTHEQLTKKKDGLYRNLWQLQAGGFIQ